LSIEAVIFDFGGVFTASPFTGIHAWHESKGLDPAQGVRIVFGPYDQDTDHPWHRLERGEITVFEARDHIVADSVARVGREIDPFELLAAMSGSEIRAEMVDFCRSVRADGFRTGLLTNNAKEFEDFWRPLLPLDELFDDVVDSSEVGLRKPDARIYHLALERLGVDAADAVFVDDAPGNVAGAERVGIRSVLIGPERADVPAALDALRVLVGG
jgi:epoxide hydrolase-like predicted phosphatase